MFFIDDINNFIETNDKELDLYKNIKYNNINLLPRNLENEFLNLVNKIEKDNNIINYTELKDIAYNNLSEIVFNNIFNPKNCINIIINEIKNLYDVYNIDLSNKDIYNFNISYYSKVLRNEIILNISLDMIEFPGISPSISILKPKMKNNINYHIKNMDYFNIRNWKSTNSLKYIINEIEKLLDIYGEIINNNSYSELSNLLVDLAIISKININKLDNFQINILKSDRKKSISSGTGYGTTNSSIWDIKKYIESDKYQINKLINIVNKIYTNIINNNNYMDDVENSCLVEFLVINLTENLDIEYINTNIDYLINLIKLFEYLYNNNNKIYDIYIDKIKSNIEILKLILRTYNNNILIKLYDISMLIIDNIKIEEIDNLEIKSKYIENLKIETFKFIENLSSVYQIEDKHIINRARIAKEISILNKSLPFDYESSIYVRVREDNMRYIQALIIPSHDTPYSCGCFLFHMLLPLDYPKYPPLVKLITTGNNTVRFNPNLYNCGKVCLSLLGTWSGNASETWNEKSTILQVLISIQSLIFIDKPYFNEPGYENMINSENGKKASLEYNKNIYYNTIRWSMIDMINNPPLGFEDVIKNHFFLKKDHILEELKSWTLNDNKILKIYEELKEILTNLKYNI